jgi:hypothetical protein
MSLSRADASAALADAAAAETRSVTFRAYQSAAPHLIIWGIAWALAYALGDLSPRYGNAAWLVIAPAASLCDILAARADRRGESNMRLIGGAFAIVVVFVGGTVAIMAPTDPRQVGAFIPLVVAAAYAIFGLMHQPRLLVLGAGLAALTLTGFFVLPAHFLLWMAVVGGGGLILGGLWLRQA